MLVRSVVNEVLAAVDSDFSKAYADSGRPSIPPERLLRALLLQAFYTIRSERQLMEQLDYNLLYRWFVGLGMDQPVWVPTVFTKNRDRLLEAERGAQVPGGTAGPQGVARAVVGRAFLGRRHADCRLGLDEELSDEGRLGRSTWPAAMSSAISTARSAIARAAARRPSSASWATC